MTNLEHYTTPEQAEQMKGITQKVIMKMVWIRSPNMSLLAVVYFHPYAANAEQLSHLLFGMYRVGVKRGVPTVVARNQPNTTSLRDASI
ncbi:hypothetical protein JTB14_014792 [Gonioctena quinquepunctata]|nr:hypothetical protein JTB14_014792 [Gonioctena quinquepunctata]